MNAVCPLCAQISGDAQHDVLHQLLGEGEYRRCVLDLGEFAAMPSVGALVAGHLLLCPRKHTRSFASLRGHEREAADTQLDRLAGQLRTWAGKEVQMFEHGNARHGTAVACTVEHAHVHVLAGVPDMRRLLRAQAHWIAVPRRLADLTAIVGDGEYVMYGDQDGRMWVTLAAPDRPIPSQWLRQVAAAALGMPQRWNWREHPSPELTRASLDALRMGGAATYPVLVAQA